MKQDTPRKRSRNVDETITPSTEAEKVFDWRLDELQRAGYSWDQATSLAESNCDLHLAVALLGKGCSPDLALRILL